MAEPYGKDTWVEIRAIVLGPGARAPQVPEDTRHVPLEMRAKGFLVAPAEQGEEAEILTVAGRRLCGTLVRANPSCTHGFGPPISALLPIAQELRARLRNEETEKP